MSQPMAAVTGGKRSCSSQFSSKALTRFRLPWQWDGTPALLQSRAIDETGYVQPRHDAMIDVRGVNSFYHYNAIQTWRIDHQRRGFDPCCMSACQSP